MRTSKEYFCRELIVKYEFNIKNNKQHEQTDKFVASFSEYMKQGGEIEIIDGENNEMHTHMLLRLFDYYTKHNKIEDFEDGLLVISVIGL